MTTRILTGITPTGTPHLATTPAPSARRSSPAVGATWIRSTSWRTTTLDQVRRSRSYPALAPGNRRDLAGRRPGRRACDLLPAVGHPRDSRADLVAHLRQCQGAAQPRACLQGRGGPQCRGWRRPGRRRDHGPLQLSGADGRGHPDVQRAQDPGRPRPGAARGDGPRHRPAFQPPVRQRPRVLRPARSGDRGKRRHPAGPGRAQDVQELRQHHPLFSRPGSSRTPSHASSPTRARRASRKTRTVRTCSFFTRPSPAPNRSPRSARNCSKAWPGAKPSSACSSCSTTNWARLASVTRR